MHRWDALNPRQLALLERVAAGDDLSSEAGVASRTSAYALSNRGLVVISKRGGMWRAWVTEDGRYYLKHGHHPEHPDHRRDPEEAKPRHSATRDTSRRNATTQGARSAPGTSPTTATAAEHRPAAVVPGLVERRRKAATDLVEHLVTRGPFTVCKPDEKVITEWRRVVDFAKRHGLAPHGQRIEKQRTWQGDLQITLVDGPHPNTRSRSDSSGQPEVPVPSTLRAVDPVVAELRDDRDRLVMTPTMRRRALLLLQALAAEATRRGYAVKAHAVERRHIRPAYSYLGQSRPARYSRREGQIDIVIDDFTYTLTLDQEFPQTNDPQRAQQMVIEAGYSRAGRRHRWADRQRWTLEDKLAEVLQELELRAVEDRKRRLEEQRAKEERQRRWEAAMAEARSDAVREHYATRLRHQAKRWQEAGELRAYCDALESRIASVNADQQDRVPEARQWLYWAREYIAVLDPLSGLPTMPSPPKLSPDDLKPFLKDWSPYGPEASGRTWGG